MTFKELSILEENFLRPSFRSGGEKSGLLRLFENQSPIMKFWFAAMLVNLVVIFCLL